MASSVYVEPLHVERYEPSDRSALTIVGDSTPTTLTAPAWATFVRIYPQSPLLVEIGENSAADPGEGSLRMPASDPAWLQLPPNAVVKLLSVSGNASTSPVWGGPAA